MAVADDLTAISNDLSTLSAAVQKVVDEVNVPATESVADQVLAALLPVLTTAGYTVTAPEVESTTEDATETTEETPAA